MVERGECCNQGKWTRFNEDAGSTKWAIEGKAEKEEGEESILCEYAGEKIDIAFNVNYLQEILSTLDSENIEINIESFAFIACPSNNLQSLLLSNTNSNINFADQILSIKKLFVYGDLDELIEQDLYNTMLRDFCKPSEIIKIDHTDHFFSNEIPQLSNKIGDFFNSTLK